MRQPGPSSSPDRRAAAGQREIDHHSGHGPPEPLRLPIEPAHRQDCPPEDHPPG
ncbi:MAG: hypothetical protein MZV70_28340 [Desulfobacterales bacterium]|nr:hypothetical protein [Desulfobacterales bacterium]